MARKQDQRGVTYDDRLKMYYAWYETPDGILLERDWQNEEIAWDWVNMQVRRYQNKERER